MNLCQIFDIFINYDEDSFKVTESGMLTCFITIELAMSTFCNNTFVYLMPSAAIQIIVYQGCSKRTLMYDFVMLLLLILRLHFII